MAYSPSLPNVRSWFDPVAIVWAAIFWGLGEGVKLGIHRRHSVASASIRVYQEIFFWFIIAFQFLIMSLAYLQDIVGDMRKTGDLWTELR